MYTYKAVPHTKCIVLMTQMAAVVIALQWKVTQYFTVFIWRKKEDCLLALKYSFLCVLYVHIFPLTFIIKCPDSILEPDKREEDKLSRVATSGLDKKVLRLALSP